MPPALVKRSSSRRAISRQRAKKVRASSNGRPRAQAQIVVITGMSGSGKASVLKAFEDLGYYCVDNLPVELIPRFAELAKHSSQIERTALVVDIREGRELRRLPAILKNLKRTVDTTLLFLEADDEALVRRFSETRRPHPLSNLPVKAAISDERRRLQPIRKLADLIIDTSKLNVHELRSHAIDRFRTDVANDKNIFVSCVSFGYKQGVPQDADLVFDVRFLPNPHFIPELRPFTGRHPKVAKYIRSFPQTQEFLDRITELLIYLLPHYVREGKSYLTIAIGCTGGRHRSVMISEELKKRLAKAGYNVKITHRDSPV
ncbi:MAG TPA: RNase adapter RapZ [Terriglobales bacterium]|nr:RNase adapter RapZ [Terriglobales bacterium]